MSIRFWSQLGVGVGVLVFATLVSWYEGSALLDQPWEWRYSTPISGMIHGVVEGQADIVGLDFFVYAAKFSPFFPGMMIISTSYLIVLIGFRTFKRSGIRIFFTLTGVVEIALGLIISTSPTAGGNLLCWLFLSIGLLLIVLAIVIHFLPFRMNDHFTHQ